MRWGPLLACGLTLSACSPDFHSESRAGAQGAQTAQLAGAPQAPVDIDVTATRVSRGGFEVTVTGVPTADVQWVSLSVHAPGGTTSARYPRTAARVARALAARRLDWLVLPGRQQLPQYRGRLRRRWLRRHRHPSRVWPLPPGRVRRHRQPGWPAPSQGGDRPTLAWAEGQATYIAMAITGVPYYIDTNFSNGGWFVELEDRVHDASMSGSMSQYILEWMVAELLWDVGDRDEDADGDPMLGHHDDVILVTTGYFHSPDYVGRGAGGVDLVDWLDGWFWRMGLESCGTMRQLVSGVFEFPYEFSTPVGACP